jgi:hypothetical protein
MSATSAPRLTNKARIIWTSRILGIFLNITGSSVSKLAAINGKAAFLFPDGVITP